MFIRSNLPTSDNKLSNLKQNQSLIGVLNPYSKKYYYKEMKMHLIIFLRVIAENNNKSTINGYSIISSESCWIFKLL